MAVHELAPPFLLVIFAFIPAVAVELQFGDVNEALTSNLAQSGTAREARLCLSRVAPLPKAEGYGALCTSIESLYRQQQSSTSSLLAFKEEGERARSSNAALERRIAELEAQVEEGEHHKIKREKDWQAAARKFQADVASRDAQWQATVRRLETVAAQKYQAGLKDRDTHWQGIVRRLETEKKSVEQQAVESQKQKEAMEASTSAGTSSRRAILLSLSREKKRSQDENKEVRGLLEQIKALQTENAQLVQRCVVGNS